MENEKVAIEAIAEEGARAYSKTVWTETTPITADKLNKMENGIAAALPLTGGTLTGALGINGGKLTFSNQIGGGQMSSLINCQELQNKTGNGQMMTAYNSTIYVGNPNTQLYLESLNNPILVRNGTNFTLYHTGNKPTAWDIGAMSSNAPTFQGNMIQVGPGGRDWIYHINADAGSLHIAPHNNGTANWDSQITFDRNGVMYCNGRKKVPTMADQHAAHYMFRYGSGLGGANGYITFSY